MGYKFLLQTLLKSEKDGFLPYFDREYGEDPRQKKKMKGFVFKEQSVAGEIMARRTPIHSALSEGRLRTMRSPHPARV
jgi:hypothetical protein